MDTRASPPSGAPPAYTFVGRVYKRSLRPIVLLVAFLAGIWTLFSGIGFFRTAGALGASKVPSLVTFSIVLGILYMVLFVIQCIGAGASLTQKIPLVRAYAWLSVLTVIIVLATGIIRLVLHFTLKDDIINVCSDLSEGDTIVFFSFWGPRSSQTLSADEARKWCTNSWSRESWSEILSLIFILILAALFASIAFNFLRQVLDPSSVLNAVRPPVRVDVYPTHYNPPYGAPPPGYGPPPGAPAQFGYNAPYSGGYQQYAPPPGPPPVPGYETKPPGYVGGDDSAAYGKDDKDPFADFGGVSSQQHRPEERDVTSRPAPGGSETFR